MADEYRRFKKTGAREDIQRKPIGNPTFPVKPIHGYDKPSLEQPGPGKPIPGRPSTPYKPPPPIWHGQPPRTMIRDLNNLPPNLGRHWLDMLRSPTPRAGMESNPISMPHGGPWAPIEPEPALTPEPPVMQPAPYPNPYPGHWQPYPIYGYPYGGKF